MVFSSSSISLPLSVWVAVTGLYPKQWARKLKNLVILKLFLIFLARENPRFRRGPLKCYSVAHSVQCSSHRAAAFRSLLTSFAILYASVLKIVTANTITRIPSSIFLPLSVWVVRDWLHNTLLRRKLRTLVILELFSIFFLRQVARGKCREIIPPGYCAVHYRLNGRK